MKCESCGRNDVSGRVACLYCGGKLIEVSRSEITIRCPSCNDVMVKKENSGVTFDQCGSCNGAWYDKFEIEVLLKKSKSELDAVEEQNVTNFEIPTDKHSTRAPKTTFGKEERDDFFRRPASTAKPSIPRQNSIKESSFYRKCPICKATMQRVNYLQKTGVIVDVCTHHGIFLDDGEFDSLHHFIQKRLWL